MTPIPEKVLIVGLDALTPRLVDVWIDEGRLPNLARFRNDGAWGSLNSVPNRNSAAAWSTMVTGLNPGKHGLYWFTEDEPETYTYRFVNASDRRGRTLWRLLSDNGKRVAVVNVPMTYPAEKVNGVLAAGLDAPGIDAPGFTDPPDFAGRLMKLAGGEYLIHTGVNLLTDPERKDEGLARLHRSIDARTKAAETLLKQDEWDFGMIVFTESDVVQHYFFREMEEGEAGRDARYKDAIRDVYEHLDATLGTLIEAAGPEALVVVVSDHGARRDEGLARAIPDWLRQLGHLSYRARSKKTARSVALKLAARTYRFLDKRLSTEVKHRLSERFPGLRRKVETTMSFSSIDWSRTRAYTDGKRPEIWINLEGRQGHGIVSEESYEETRDTIIEQLMEARCEATGKRVVNRAWRRDDCYHGPFVERSPDIVVEWADEGTCLDLIYPDGRRLQLDPGHLQDAAMDGLSGGHSQHGIVGLLGPGVRNHPLENAQIGDVTPTVLFALDQPIPEDIDGSILLEAFDEDIRGRKPRSGQGSDLDKGTSSGYSDKEEEEIRAHLKALGYVE